MADEKIPGRIPVEGVQPETGDTRGNLMQSDKEIPVMVEIQVSKDRDKNFALSPEMFNIAATLGASGFRIDSKFKPSKLSPRKELAPSMEEANKESIVIRGMIPENRIEDLKRLPNVLSVNRDVAVFEPFGGPSL